jgi:hypothetical protein
MSLQPSRLNQLHEIAFAPVPLLEVGDVGRLLATID